MESLRLEIAAHFGEGGQPDSDGVVLWDGFDQLEKERAAQFYTGKTWSDVLEYLHGLKDEAASGAAYYLEEWSVLSPKALPYYLRAYLELLLEALSSPQPDEEFVFFFLGELYQVIYMHKGSPFNPTQTLLLQKIAQSVAENANDQKRFAYFGRDISAQVVKFLAELRAHDS
jgi:hypothetical protein